MNKIKLISIIILVVIIIILTLCLVGKTPENFKEYWEEHDKEFLKNTKLNNFNKQILKYNLQQENEFIKNILLKSPKKSIFLDVGAYNGSSCLYISKELKKKDRDDIRIIAFEPNKTLSDKINEESKKLKLNVKCINIAVSNNKATVFKKSDEGAGTMYDTNYKGAAFKSDTLDNLLSGLNIDNVFFMKIDVEGHEPKVLDGAEKILKNTMHLYIEMWTDIHYEERAGGPHKGMSYNKKILSYLSGFYPIQKYEKNYYFKHKSLFL
jgi:FkbM family methyltransferase